MASCHVRSLCCSGDVIFWLRDRIVKFKTCQIQKYGILAIITKFNARQFFLLYGNSLPREDHALILLMWVRCCPSTKKYKVPYSLKQTPWLLFISWGNFEWLLFESSYYSIAAFIKLGMEDDPLPQGRWSGCRHQGVNPKGQCHACHCNGYWAQGIRPFADVEEDEDELKENELVLENMLLHYTIFLQSGLNKLYLQYILWYCHEVCLRTHVLLEY